MTHISNTLEQSLRNPKFFNDKNRPDTDCLFIELSGQALSVTPNLSYGNTNMSYTCPVNASTTITMNNFTNSDDKTLHKLFINNANNVIDKTFNFGNNYVFLDTNSNSLVVTAGLTAVFFGAIIAGKMYLRESVDSTN